MISTELHERVCVEIERRFDILNDCPGEGTATIATSELLGALNSFHEVKLISDDTHKAYNDRLCDYWDKGGKHE